jgi:alkylated DNA repair protein (DNA oxidative demethylase)
MTEQLHTDSEMRRLVALLEHSGASTIAVGHGRTPAAQVTATAFADLWRTRGGQLTVVVDWPAEAASWLRQARRLTAHHVAAWVIADTAAGWAPMAARLAAAPDWKAQDTFAFAAVIGDELTPLIRTGALNGMSGPTPDDQLWHIHDRRVVRHTPRNRNGDLTPTELVSRTAVEILPGAFHLPGWLTIDAQRDIVTYCRQRATGPAPMRAAKLPRGHTMSVQTACLGWHWAPYRYTRTADDTDGAPVPPMPAWLIEMGQQVLADAHGTKDESRYVPDAALINFYDEHARLGMHQDKDERSPEPVVSLSIGQPCIFRLGTTHQRSGPHADVTLRSGDAFVFGGPARFAYHGVPKVLADPIDPAIGLPSGRLNITLRVTGLDG